MVLTPHGQLPGRLAAFHNGQPCHLSSFLRNPGPGRRLHGFASCLDTLSEPGPGPEKSGLEKSGVPIPNRVGLLPGQMGLFLIVQMALAKLLKAGLYAPPFKADRWLF